MSAFEENMSAFEENMSKFDENMSAFDENMTTLDENLYSRQIAVYGKNAMKSLTKSRVLVLGYNGACLELLKNLILAGISKINLVTDEIVNIEDLATNYYATEEDVGDKVTNVIKDKLSELNPYVNLVTNEEYLIENYDTVILVNDNLQNAITINKNCRTNNKKFIWMNYYGLFSNVFCDFGDHFTIYDNDGEQEDTSILQEISNDGTFVCLENEPHNLQTNDMFILTDVTGIKNINNQKFTVEKVINKNTFIVKETDIDWEDYMNGGRITHIKPHINMEFESLQDQIFNPNITNIDEDGQMLHKLFIKLINYKSQFNELPEPWSKEYNKIFDINYKYSDYFHYTARGQFQPICSIIGAYVAQECIKSITSKYTPINQWFYYHCYDILPEKLLLDDTTLVKGDRYDGLRIIFGNDLLKEIRNKSYFIVGSGAIGCEHIKNFTMSGFGTLDSKLIITDMDTIEKSNLNRQFLFRNSDIGHLKSKIAAREASKMNKDVNIEWHQDKICHETEHLFGKEFYDSIDGISNALDNINARLYVDQRCLFFDKPLFESGTLGTKGNVQVIIPRVTENYGASQDQQEKSFPVCTIKNFPNSIEHTIHWARNDFEEIFSSMPNDWLRLIKNPEVTKTMSPNEKGEFINNIIYMWNNKPSEFVDCIRWAINRFYDKFNHQIVQLLHSYPKDIKTTLGSSFWSAGKRCPDEIKLDNAKELHNEYIYHTTLLMAEMFNIIVPDNVKQLCLLEQSQYEVKCYIPSNDIKIAATEAEDKENEKKKYTNNIDTKLPNTDELEKYKVKVIDFEKDDDTNHHIDFITSTSNLRATNYRIEPSDKYTTKIIAGKIIPAISTTTSIVSGLVTIEMIKNVFGKQNIESYKNSFINLAISFSLLSEPMPTSKITIKDKEFTPWDYYNLKDDYTVEKLLETLSNFYEYKIDTLMFGSKMLISPMTPFSQKEKRMNMKLSELLFSFDVELKDTIYELQIESLESDEEIDFPNLKFHYISQEVLKNIAV